MGLLSPSRPHTWSNSGQAFQILDQPDHRERIPVTVVEQVSPDSVSFVASESCPRRRGAGRFRRLVGPDQDRLRASAMKGRLIFRVHYIKMRLILGTRPGISSVSFSRKEDDMRPSYWLLSPALVGIRAARTVMEPRRFDPPAGPPADSSRDKPVTALPTRQGQTPHRHALFTGGSRCNGL